MRTINSKPVEPKIGRKVIVKKEYKSGNHYLYIGEVGNIVGVSTYNLPDFGLFDVKVYDIKFASYILSWGEGIIKEYLNVL